MRHLPRALVAGALLVGSIGGAWAVTRGADTRDPVVAGVSSAPRDAISVAVTAWSQLPDSLDRASLNDLTSASILIGFAAEFDERLGWGPTDLAWEAAVVTPRGPVLVLGLGDLDPADVDESWETIAQRDGDGWTVSGASRSFQQNFTHVRVLRSSGILLASARSEALPAVIATIDGRSQSLMADRGVATLGQAAAGNVAVFFRGGPRLCFEPETGMDEDDVLALRQIEKRHGALADPTWIMRALDPEPRRYLFGTTFDTPGQAREQARIRGALTSGPFLGRYGSVEDSLTDLRSSTDGNAVLFDFAATDRSEPYLTDSGTVLFNSCAID